VFGQQLQAAGRVPGQRAELDVLADRGTIDGFSRAIRYPLR